AGECAAGAFKRHADRRWSAGGAQPGHLSPRSEARKRDADRRRTDQDSGLRTGAAVETREAAGTEWELRSVVAGAAAADCAGCNLHGAWRNDCLYGAGAICDGPEQRAERHLCVGADSVRDGEWTASVPSARCAGAAEHSSYPVCSSALPAGDRSGHSSRAGERDSAVPGEAAVGEVWIGGGGTRGAEDDCEVAAAGHDGDGH